MIRGEFIEFIIKCTSMTIFDKLKITHKKDILVLSKCTHCKFCNEYGNWLYAIGRRGCRRHPGRLKHNNGGSYWGCCGLNYEGRNVTANSKEINKNHGKLGCMVSDHCFDYSSSFCGLDKEVAIPLSLVIICRKLALKDDVLCKNILNVTTVSGDDGYLSKSNVEIHTYHELNWKMDKHVNDNKGGTKGMDESIILKLPDNKDKRWCGDNKTINLTASEVTFSLMDVKIT